MLELSRILTAGGATLASTCFTIWGMGHAVRGETRWEVAFGFWGMIIGMVLLVIGWIMHQRLAED